MKTVYVDVDHVVAKPDGEPQEGPRDYSKSNPIPQNIDRVNEIHRSGHEVIYYTARGTETGEDWYYTTWKQLRKWGCEFDQLRMGKPAFDVLIDDKAYNVDRLAEIKDTLTS